MVSNEGKRGHTSEQARAKSPFYAAIFALCRFALGSLRLRIGQAVLVTLALLLIVGVAQAIGALGDVSSTLARQQIAANWRAPADLLVRPQAAVSQPERAAGWINPGSALEYYGGVSARQTATISSLSQVAQTLPFATAGWQRLDIITPVVLQQQGLYRITAQWTGAQKRAGNIVDYVEVSDLANLVSEEPVLTPEIQHLVLPPNAASVVYTMSVPALQLLVGVAPAQENMLRQLLLQGGTSSSFAGLTIHIDKLNGQLTTLSACLSQTMQAACWQHVTVQTGRASYLAQDVQLLRYSQANYSAASQQLAAGQLVLDTQGDDMQGPIYRELLSQHVMLPDGGMVSSLTGTGQSAGGLPLDTPEHAATLAGALQFIPLAQACLVNGAQCYSGLYIRLRGVDRYNAKSLAVLQSTAATITARTGLHVDILDGSSTRTVTLESGNSENGLSQTWQVVGVAVQITHGVDALQKTLFILCALICLLAIGAAGVLIGTGRQNEARILEHLGWSRSLRTGAYIFDAFLLALPGCILASLLIVLAGKFWPGNVPSITMWALLACGVVIYGAALVSLACGIPERRRSGKKTGRRPQGSPPIPTSTPASTKNEPGEPLRSHSRGGGRARMGGDPCGRLAASADTGGSGDPCGRLLASLTTSATVFVHKDVRENDRERWWGCLRRPRLLLANKSSAAFHARVTAPLVCAVAITATVFLIAEEYLMVSGLNRDLVVTVLGDQVRVALQGPQVLLLLLVLLTALLTIGLCTSLLLRGRRQELALLARAGWERRHVLLRLLRESWWMAALSGMGGALLALGVIEMAGSLPPLWVVGSVIAGGPLLGMALASLVVYTLARQELKSVYLKRV